MFLIITVLKTNLHMKIAENTDVRESIFLNKIKI